MGILDEAIREHLDLKRRHGARDAELREIEDEAFGSAEQPDPFAAGELFNEVSAPGEGEEPTRLAEPEALRREPETPPPGESAPPEPTTSEPELGAFEEPASPPEGATRLPGQTELPGADEIPGQEQFEQPVEDLGPPSGPEPEPAAPSESLEELIAEEEPFPEDTGARAAEPEDLPLDPEAPAPASEETEAPPEPESSVPEPPPPPPETAPEPPGRARGRIDVPTQEHPPPGDTGGVPAVPPAEPDLEPEPEPEPAAPESDGPQLYDFESDEAPLVEGPDEPQDEFEALGPAEEEAPYLEEEEPYAEEPASGTRPLLEEPGTEVRPALEDEEAYEGGEPDPEEVYEEDETDEGLWFEQGPPKDFDFDD